MNTQTLKPQIPCQYFVPPELFSTLDDERITRVGFPNGCYIVGMNDFEVIIGVFTEPQLVAISQDKLRQQRMMEKLKRKLIYMHGDPDALGKMAVPVATCPAGAKLDDMMYGFHIETTAKP